MALNTSRCNHLMPLRFKELSMIQSRDVTKFAFELDNVQTRTFSADSKFIKFFVCLSSNLNLRSTRSAPHVYTHRPPEQQIEQMCIA